MNKQEAIKQRLSKPFEVGDYIVVTVTYVKTISVKRNKKIIDETKEVNKSLYGKIIKIG